MCPFFVVAKPLGPLTPLITPKKPTPGESTLNRRSIDAAKSLALTEVPSEYFRPSRSLKLSLVPSAETFGMLSARYGSSVAPSEPETCLYPSRPSYTYQLICQAATV